MLYYLCDIDNLKNASVLLRRNDVLDVRAAHACLWKMLCLGPATGCGAMLGLLSAVGNVHKLARIFAIVSFLMVAHG